MDEPGASGAVVESLILDLLDWLDREERTYPETLEAWRTSCPRMPVWEDANDRALVVRTYRGGHWIVSLSARGHALLRRRRPDRAASRPP